MVEVPNRFLEKARHHTIPEFYLRNFVQAGSSKDGKLWRYERGCRDPIRVHPSDAAVIKNYYRAKDKDGQEHNVFEHHLEKLETLVAPIIRSIVVDRKSPTAEDCARLSLFTSSMYCRTTAFRAMCDEFAFSFLEKVVYAEAQDKERYHAKMQELIEQGIEVPGDIEEGRIWFLNRDNYTIRPNKNLALLQYFTLLPVLAEDIVRMNHTIMASTENIEFLTSDNPVGIIDSRTPTGTWSVDMRSSGTQVSLPLSAQFVFYASWGGPEGFASCQPFVQRHVNKVTASRAHRYVFSPFRGKFIRKWLNETPPMIAKMEWPNDQ